jgi:pre-rRNA-processing protein IPI1
MKITAGLQSKMIPYFCISHPHRGVLAGPFTKLPLSSPTRRLALDCAASLTAVQQTKSEPLLVAIQKAVGDSDDAYYWNQIRDVVKLSEHIL